MSANAGVGINCSTKSPSTNSGPGSTASGEVVPPGWFGAEPPVFRLVSGGEASVTLENVRQRPAWPQRKPPPMCCGGNRAEYTLAVTNTGNVVLSDVAVIDAMAGLSTTIPLLKLGRVNPSRRR